MAIIYRQGSYVFGLAVIALYAPIHVNLLTDLVREPIKFFSWKSGNKFHYNRQHSRQIFIT
jgi:hypothetical protein